jgi:hypothetical protein
VNVRRAAKYLKPKGVETAYIFGSGLKTANPKHDLDVVVDLLPTARNKRKFQDATDHGIDLCLLYQAELLFSVGNDEYLYTDNGDFQGLDDVKAKKIEIR